MSKELTRRDVTCWEEYLAELPGVSSTKLSKIARVACCLTEFALDAGISAHVLIDDRSDPAVVHSFAPVFPVPVFHPLLSLTPLIASDQNERCTVFGSDWAHPLARG